MSLERLNMPVSIDTKDYTDYAIRFLKDIENLDIIPPKKGKYDMKARRYSIGDRSVMLSELQFNLGTILATEPSCPLHEAYIRAGYAYASYFNEAKNVKRFKAHMVGMCNTKLTPQLNAFINYVKHGAAEELRIDKTWVLNESVNLFEEAKRSKNFSVAARLLDNIAMHVDVDAKVSNKLVVENTVDYAALLNAAEGRLPPLEGELEQSPLEFKDTVN